MCLETNDALGKDEIFGLMGKYYGNAYYRNAIKYAWSKHDLGLIKNILDTVNALGYNFSNLGRLSDHEDIRFIPIIFENYGKFDSHIFSEGLIGSLCFKSYHSCTPNLLKLYKDENDIHLKFRISNSLFLVRNRKYISDYFSVVMNDGYGKNYDMIMDILCKFHIPEALHMLIRLFEKYPEQWTFAFLRLGRLYHDPIIIPYLQQLTEHENGEYRQMAKKALCDFKH